MNHHGGGEGGGGGPTAHLVDVGDVVEEDFNQWETFS